MGAVAVDAEPVQRRDAERRSEVTVRAAAGHRAVLQVEAASGGDRPRLLVESRDLGALLIGRTVHAAADHDLHIRIMRLEAEDALEFVENLRQNIHH